MEVCLLLWVLFSHGGSPGLGGSLLSVFAAKKAEKGQISTTPKGRREWVGTNEAA